MKNILIPTDFSSNADHAIAYAINIFKCERANFYFLHAYADEVYGPFHNLDKETFEKQRQIHSKSSENKLTKLVNDTKTKTHNPMHKYEMISSFESLVDALNNVADSKNIDLIIMGTRGATANSKITFGSNTVQVFKYVKCPVLAVPDHYDYSQPKKILFPRNEEVTLKSDGTGGPILSQYTNDKK